MLCEDMAGDGIGKQPLGTHPTLSLDPTQYKELVLTVAGRTDGLHAFR